MSQTALKRIEALDEAELRRFLKTNGMGPCLKVFELEHINGKKFLNLSKNDFVRWKKTIFESEIKTIEKFLKSVKDNPAGYLKEEGLADKKCHPTRTRKSTFYFDLSPTYEDIPLNINDITSQPAQSTTLQEINFSFESADKLPDSCAEKKRPPIPKKPLILRENSCRSMRGSSFSKKSILADRSEFIGELEKKLEYKRSVKEVLTTPKRPLRLKLDEKEDEEMVFDEVSQKDSKEDPATPSEKLEGVNDSMEIADQNSQKDRLADYLEARKCPSLSPNDSKYYLDLSRDEAEVYLKIKAKDGGYLFRPSTRYYCAMSVLFESDVHHIPVQSSDGKRLELAIQGNNKQFDSLDEIVDYFNLNPIQAATFQKIIRLNSHISINE